MSPPIERLRRVPLREVWKREAADFSSWLAQNVEVIGEAVGFPLANASTEQSAGTLSIDIVAEDDEGNAVVIENQLERSDHDHLGKVLTYLAVRGARRAIWIVSDARPEHIEAVQWLNKSGLGEFYMMKLEAVQIGDSSPAPLLTLIAYPTEELRRVGEAKEEENELLQSRRRFWEALLLRCKERLRLFANVSVTGRNYIQAAAGRSGVNFFFRVRQHEVDVLLYIDDPAEAGKVNREILKRVMESRAEIEAATSPSISWTDPENRRACEVCQTLTLGGWKDEPRWAEVHEDAISMMARLEKAVRPVMERLRAQQE